ncbi:MAG: putative Haloacid dehalogenase superfamily hydrolase, subfamily PSPase-like [Nitrospira sp.]|nr:putative Haloacid dehalogenase superfamily hydrolase, subfamily PSPase-like [Nitrospira sp.]
MQGYHDLHPSLVRAATTASPASLAALFDVDNTLVPGEACEVRFFRYLWRRGLVGWRELRRSVSWLVTQGRSVSIHPLRERKIYLEGKNSALIESCARDFFQREMVRNISRKGRDRLEAHRQSGHQLILVSGAPDFLITPLAETLNVSTLFAARIECQGACYTGAVIPPLPYGIGKRQLVVSHAQEKGLDLTSSFAYGDSPGDTEILDLVGYPVVVNPIRGMLRIARDRGWPVVDWT